jgi:peptidoglycan/LPS O-acetylase OafA/YrhL
MQHLTGRVDQNYRHVPTSSDIIRYRNDIDGLRSIAVLSVIFFHFDIFVPHPGYWIMIAPGGFIGVDVFFVISGYLITKVIYGDITLGRYRTADFYNRRIRRIFPALFTVFAFCIVAAFFLRFPSETADIGRAIVASIFFVSNVFFYKSYDYFDQRLEANPLLHTWSLSVEEQFYLVFPILVFGLRRFSSETRIKTFLVIAFASLTYSEWTAIVEPEAAFYLVRSRAWELLIGALLAIGVIPTLRRYWHSELVAFLGLALIIASIEWMKVGTPFPGLAALAPCLGAAAIIHSGATMSTFTGRFLAIPPLRFIGLISYSLYLWHWPIIVFYRFLREPTNKEKFLLVVVCILLAAISWRFIEQPFRQRARLGAYATVVIGGASMLAAAGIVVIVSITSIAFWNIPSRAEHVLAYTNYDGASIVRRGACFISKDNDVYDKDDCLALKPDQKNFLLIGDSHAAHLWPGLQAAYPNVNFLQATASGCKPHIGTGGERRCTELMRFIFEKFVPRTHVDGIILSARWNDGDIRNAKVTAETLRPYAGRIFISGPIIEYDQPLPRLLALALTNKLDQTAFVAKYRRRSQEETDRLFASALADDPGRYLSVYRTLCDPQCAIWANEQVPLQFDYGHLTREGSILLAFRFGSQLFAGKHE